MTSVETITLISESLKAQVNYVPFYFHLFTKTKFVSLCNVKRSEILFQRMAFVKRENATTMKLTQTKQHTCVKIIFSIFSNLWRNLHRASNMCSALLAIRLLSCRWRYKRPV